MRPSGRVPGPSCTLWLHPGCVPSSRLSSWRVTRHWVLMSSTGAMLFVGLHLPLPGCLDGADEESLTVRESCKAVACLGALTLKPCVCLWYPVCSAALVYAARSGIAGPPLHRPALLIQERMLSARSCSAASVLPSSEQRGCMTNGTYLKPFTEWGELTGGKSP